MWQFETGPPKEVHILIPRSYKWDLIWEKKYIYSFKFKYPEIRKLSWIVQVGSTCHNCPGNDLRGRGRLHTERVVLPQRQILE
jgi:hypothetical protein